MRSPECGGTGGQLRGAEGSDASGACDLCGVHLVCDDCDRKNGTGNHPQKAEGRRIP